VSFSKTTDLPNACLVEILLLPLQLVPAFLQLTPEPSATAVMDASKLENNATMVLGTATHFLMHAELTVPSTDVATESSMLVKNATPTHLTARLANWSDFNISLALSPTVNALEISNHPSDCLSRAPKPEPSI